MAPCACAPTLILYRDEVNATFPGRDKSSDGCCASSAHSGQNPTSDHEPGMKGATKGFAHAYDLDEDVGPVHTLEWLVPHLLRDHRCKYLIYEKRLFYPDGTVKPYAGANPHDKHLHMSVKPDATFDKAPWRIAAAWAAAQGGSQPTPVPPPTTEESDKMRYFIRPEGGFDHWLTDGITRRHMLDKADVDRWTFILGDNLFNHGAAIEMPQAAIDAIPLA